jgi:lipoprotein-releasing system ATP-binding protein
MALVEAKNVKKVYEHEGRSLEVLRGINLTIEAGEMVGVVGQSGAGKSTFLHCLGTLDIPTSGELFVDGSDVTKLSGARLADLRNRSLGFVFQFHHLLPEFTAVENVFMPGLIQGKRRRELEARAHDLLTDVGLGHRLHHRPTELSGGEQQRVAVARALLLNPKLLLADEPTGNLDSKTSSQIHELFFTINEKHGTTIVVVTHNAQLAESMPRVVTLRDGRVESDVQTGVTRGGTKPNAPSEESARS